MTIFGYFEIFPIFLESEKGNRAPCPIKRVAQRFWGGKKRFSKNEKIPSVYFVRVTPIFNVSPPGNYLFIYFITF